MPLVEEQFLRTFFKTLYEDLAHKTVKMKTYAKTRHSTVTFKYIELIKAYSSKFPL